MWSSIAGPVPMKTGCFSFVREEILFPVTFSLAFNHTFSIPQGGMFTREAALFTDYSLPSNTGEKYVSRCMFLQGDLKHI